MFHTYFIYVPYIFHICSIYNCKLYMKYIWRICLTYMFPIYHIYISYKIHICAIYIPHIIINTCAIYVTHIFSHDFICSLRFKFIPKFKCIHICTIYVSYMNALNALSILDLQDFCTCPSSVVVKGLSWKFGSPRFNSR